MKKIMIILLGLGFALSANAQAILNFNAGATLTTNEIMNAEEWNNLLERGTVITNLLYADGTAATGITVTQSADGRYDHAPSAGYIAGLDSMATTGLWAVNGDDTSYLTISNLTAGSVWNVDIYCVRRYDARTSILRANGVNSADTNTYGGRYDLNAGVTISNVVADANGVIVVGSAGYNPSNIPAQNGVLSGATITKLPQSCGASTFRF